MMTIDEAIKHCEEVAEKYCEKVEEGLTADDFCDSCASEHRQLAEWLKELKRYKDFEDKRYVMCRFEVTQDDKEVYSNGVDLIPVFRVNQWLEHDNKFRTIEIDAAYECGKHANKWIPCSERLPEEYGNYLVTVEANDGTASIKYQMVDHYGPDWLHDEKTRKVIAWMPLPEPYKEVCGTRRKARR